jgi:hypothetical protein
MTMCGSSLRQNTRASNVRPDPYADSCCITVRFFIGTRALRPETIWGAIWPIPASTRERPRLLRRSHVKSELAWYIAQPIDERKTCVKRCAAWSVLEHSRYGSRRENASSQKIFARHFLRRARGWREAVGPRTNKPDLSTAFSILSTSV